MRLTPVGVGTGFCDRGLVDGHTLQQLTLGVARKPPRPARIALALLVSIGAATAVVGQVEQARAETFGKTSVGAHSDNGMFANYKIVHKATLSVPGSVTKLTLYAIPGIKSPSAQSLKAVIYADSGGSPGKLLATGTEVTYKGNVNGSGWLELPLASPVELNPGTYWIGFIDGSETEGMGYKYDEIANSRAYNTNTYTSGPTNPFGTATKDSEQASIYATYTPTPVFGKTSVGASFDNGMFANYKIVHKATLSALGAVTKLTLYAIPGVKSPNAQSLKAVVYSDSEGSPGELLGTGSEVSYKGNVNGSGWLELPFASPVKLAAGTYWIGFIDGSETEGMGYVYDEVSGSRAYNTNTFGSGPTNPFGTATKDSEQASIYATYTPPPSNTSVPTITGTAQQGETLTEHHGSWTNEPTSYSYRWLRCNASGASCKGISSATGQTYIPAAGDVGHELRVEETATNAAGSGSATSAATGAVAAPGSGTTITATEITTNTTWTLAGSPYILEPSTVTVTSGATLTIEPGVTVELNKKPEAFGGQLKVEGTIKAVGNAGLPIVFTSVKAAKEGAGEPGQWRAVKVDSGNASSQFAYTDFIYGGSGSACYAYGALEVSNGSTLAVEHSVFEHNERAGATVNEATLNLSYSRVERNCDGVAGGETLNVSHTSVSYNSGDGAFFNGMKKGSSFTNDTIRGNAHSGINVSDTCTKEASLYPHGEDNNIYENHPGKESANQLTSLSPCPALAVNWANNYWGSAYFLKNSSECAATETPYAGHVAYTWGGGAQGPIEHHSKSYSGLTCYWDSFDIEEVLSSPTNGVAPELTPSELQGSASVSSPNLTHCMRADPVNCATGNLYEIYTDLNIPGLNGGLTFARSYNSQAAAAATSTGPMGRGWTFTFGQSLSVDANSKVVTVTDANGATTAFTPAGGGAYTAAGWVQATLKLSEGEYSYTLPNQQVLTFGETGQLQKITDRNGDATTLTYGSGHLETVTDPAGRKLTFAYNGGGEIEKIKDPMGHEVKYAYEGGNLASVTEPGESSPRWQFSKYDSSHELEETIDGRSGKTINKYEEDRVTEQTDPLSRKTTWSYGAGETTVTDPTGSVTLMQFSGDMPSAITRAYGTKEAVTELFAYDSADNLKSVTNGDGFTTEYGYDDEDNRTSMVDPEGDETKWSYDKTHDVSSVTTPRGEATTIKRDGHGNAEVVERPAPGEKTQLTKYKYDSHGDVESMEDPLKRVTKYEYDSKGDRKSETDPEGDKRTWEYNEDSQETSTVSPRGHVEGAEEAKFTTTIERDGQGRVKKVTDPLGHETKYAYDGDGNLETLTDANGHTTTYTYNADNEATKVTEPKGNHTETEYDGDGRVKSQTDGNGHTTKYEHNALGEVAEVIDPLKRKAIKTYDGAGNLSALEDAAKRTTTYEYDAANRLIEVIYSDGKTPTVTYEYDKDGNRVKMEDGTGTSKYSYDQLDRLSESEDGHKDLVKYEYDLANQQIKITYPNGKAVTREYDNAGRLKSVTDWSEHTTKFAYDQDSELKATTWPSNEDANTYNEADQLTKTVMKKGGEELASLTYARDHDGQLESTAQKGLPGEEAVSYSYDENNRLAEGGSLEYKYDEANNPTKTGSSTNTFNEGDELTEGTAVKYSYDELGERTKRTPGTGPATTYGYDQAGNLTAIERPKEGETSEIKDSYGYNGNSLRASQAISGTTTYMTWDASGTLPLLINDGTNNYIYGPSGQPIEQIAGGGTVLYLHHDQQGSTRLLTSSVGAKEASFSYDAYGNETGHTGTATTPLGYGGQYTNSDTGLIYLRARAYDPATAQFMSVDPLQAITRAPYGYAGENPLNLSDPTGLGNWLGLGIPSPGEAIHWARGQVNTGLEDVASAGKYLAPGLDLVAGGACFAAIEVCSSAIIINLALQEGLSVDQAIYAPNYDVVLNQVIIVSSAGLGAAGSGAAFLANEGESLSALGQAALGAVVGLPGYLADVAEWASPAEAAALLRCH